MKKSIFVIILSALVGAVVGAGVVYNFQPKKSEATKNELIKEFYDVENAAHVSPHSLRRKMDKGDKSYILVDLRSEVEYERSHIIGAVNIPAYTDPDTSAYDEVDRIVGQFEALPKDKDIIT